MGESQSVDELLVLHCRCSLSLSHGYVDGVKVWLHGYVLGARVPTLVARVSGFVVKNAGPTHERLGMSERSNNY